MAFSKSRLGEPEECVRLKKIERGFVVWKTMEFGTDAMQEALVKSINCPATGFKYGEFPRLFGQKLVHVHLGLASSLQELLNSA